MPGAIYYAEAFSPMPGRRYRIEACEGHRPALDGASGPIG
jgi:hypothetical protein